MLFSAFYADDTGFFSSSPAETGKHARTDGQLRDDDDSTCPNHYHVILVMYVIEERHSPFPRQFEFQSRK